ncbi:MAG: radical SAM protein [Candidatus Omnitrophota bacterium]|nr:radical SAM protein [Candidatus Omnitrophota bacterium]
MKILLISPPITRIRFNLSGIYPLPPLGLAYIASVLERQGFQVNILDMQALNMKTEDLPKYLKNNVYHIYGLSCGVFNLAEGVKIADLLKRISPDSKIVLGGHCNSFPPETIFELGKTFDILVRGEGEGAMLNLCEQARERGQLCNLEEIAGISYKHNGKVISTTLPPYMDLDTLPFPDRHLLPNKKYRMHPPFNLYPPLTLMETSRGCVYDCSFCCLSGSIRSRSIYSVVEEIKEVVEEFKIREIHFVDPTFTINPDRIMKLCEQILEEGINLAWSCKTRVDLVSSQLLKKMAKAGCYMISYGVESGSQEILNRLDKKINTGDIKNAFDITRSAKIRTIAYLLIGSPGENDNTVEQTRDLLKEIKPDFILCGELLPDPNSIFAKDAMKEEKVSCNDLKEFFILNKDNGSIGAINIANIPRKDIKRWVSGINLSFYFRVSYIVRRLKGLKTLHELGNLAKGVFSLIKDTVSSRDRRIFKI